MKKLTDNDIIKADELVARLHKYCFFTQMQTSNSCGFTDNDFEFLHDFINRQYIPNKKHTEEKAMDYKFAGELAYKNGYTQGAKDFAKELESRCIKGGIYPAFVGAKVKEILKEMTEEK